MAEQTKENPNRPAEQSPNISHSRPDPDAPQAERTFTGRELSSAQANLNSLYEHLLAVARNVLDGSGLDGLRAAVKDIDNLTSGERR